MAVHRAPTRFSSFLQVCLTFGYVFRGSEIFKYLISYFEKFVSSQLLLTALKMTTEIYLLAIALVPCCKHETDS